MLSINPLFLKHTVVDGAGVVVLGLGADTAELQLVGVVHPHLARVVLVGLALVDLLVDVEGLVAGEDRQLPDVAGSAPRGELERVAVVVELLGVPARRALLGPCRAEVADRLVLRDVSQEGAVVLITLLAGVRLFFFHSWLADGFYETWYELNSYLTSTSLKCRGLDGSHGREGCSSRCEDCKEVTDVDHLEDDNERLKFINESGWVCGISVDLDTLFLCFRRHSKALIYRRVVLLVGDSLVLTSRL